MHLSSPAKTLRLTAVIGLALASVVLVPASVQARGTLFVEGDNVGIGIQTPTQPLHVQAADGSAKVLVEELGGGSFEELMELYNEDGNVGFRLTTPTGAADFNKIGDEFRINLLASPPELRLDASGNLIIRGSLTTQNPPGTFPDFVFNSDHELMPLVELRDFIETERHLPGVMSAAEVAENGGVNLSRLQLQLLEKVEELTLYILDQNDTIGSHQETIRALEARLAAIEGGGDTP